MKSLLFITISILTFYAAAFAQSKETISCPTISVTGPPGIVMPGETTTFTGNLSKEAEKFDLRYKWTIQGGEIIEGEKTLIIKILPNDVERDTTATFTVIGLPETCSNSASETFFITISRVPELIDEFSFTASEINKAKLDNFATRLEKDSWAMAYIIEKFEKKTPLETIKQKNLRTLEHLKSKRIEKTRIVFQNVFADKNLTQYYLVPAGVSPPSCNDCIDIE